MTSFSALTDAAASLAAQRYAMQITGQNIANADTDGYTRQRAEFAATGPANGVSRLWATAPTTGGTVAVSGTSRLNDPVIDARVRTEHGRGSYYDTKASTISSVEAYFDEPSDNGFAGELDEFWSDWSTVANTPDDSGAREALLQQGRTVADSLNGLANGLADVTDSTQQALAASVSSINDTASSVASLNQAIKVATAAGQSANNLQDQRDLLLTKLAELGGAQSQFQPDGSVTVTLGGQALVTGSTAASVGVSGTGVTVGGTAVTLSGGSAQAQSELLTTTLPGYQAQLDAVAKALHDTVNAQQAQGNDLNGQPGGDFFSGTTAATISVAITDANKVAAASSTGGTLDGSNAAKIATFGTSKTGADAAYRTFVANLGSDSARATQQSTAQQAITSNVDALQSQASGVSYDEEVTNLLTFQRAYQASSRVLTTIDDTLDTLINHTGRAGL